jgi:hypothetical protein
MNFWIGPGSYLESSWMYFESKEYIYNGLITICLQRDCESHLGPEGANEISKFLSQLTLSATEVIKWQ